MKRAYTIMEYFEKIPRKLTVMETDNSSVLQLVDHDRISKNSALDLVELATEIEKANNYVKNNACNKLKIIAEHMKFFHQQAEHVLMEAKQNAFLHNVTCNFVKYPGHIYHLYLKQSGEQYLSMLSPEEWGNSGPLQQYKGSFRLEQDHSWTPLCQIQSKDKEMNMFQHFLKDGGSSVVPQITQMYYNQ